MIQATVERMYTETEENRFLEVTYANGDKEVLYFKDFNSGAMIQNIVDRAKKMAIKDLLEHDQNGLRVAAPAPGLRRRVQGERGPAQHHQPRRLGADLRQEGRADRLHPHAHHRQAGHRAGPVDRHGRQHRPVPVTLTPVADDELERRDFEALLATRGELGPDYDAALVDSFADRHREGDPAPGRRDLGRRLEAPRQAGGGRQAPARARDRVPRRRDPHLGDLGRHRRPARSAGRLGGHRVRQRRQRAAEPPPRLVRLSAGTDRTSGARPDALRSDPSA